MSSATVLSELVKQQQKLNELKANMCDIERRVPAFLMEEKQEKAQELYAQYFRLGCEYFETEQRVKNLKFIAH